VGRNNVFEYLLFEIPLGRLQNTEVLLSFAHKIGESGLSLAGRHSIFEYVLFEMSWSGNDHFK
jgi:hypothetical protein